MLVLSSCAASSFLNRPTWFFQTAWELGSANFGHEQYVLLTGHTKHISCAGRFWKRWSLCPDDASACEQSMWAFFLRKLFSLLISWMEMNYFFSMQLVWSRRDAGIWTGSEAKQTTNRILLQDVDSKRHKYAWGILSATPCSWEDISTASMQYFCIRLE